MYIPELARHFEKEKIEGEYFLLPWAITLWGEFSGELSMIMSDGFVVDGWIWWMKVALWTLRELKEEILEKRFEGIMKIFSDSMSHRLFKQNPLERKERNIKGEILQFDITEELMAKVEKEYMCSNDQIAEMLDEKSQTTSPGKSRRSSKNQG